jgi:hypothetical protein
MKYSIIFLVGLVFFISCKSDNKIDKIVNESILVDSTPCKLSDTIFKRFLFRMNKEIYDSIVESVDDFNSIIIKNEKLDMEVIPYFYKDKLCRLDLKEFYLKSNINKQFGIETHELIQMMDKQLKLSVEISNASPNLFYSDNHLPIHEKKVEYSDDQLTKMALDYNVIARKIYEMNCENSDEASKFGISIKYLLENYRLKYGEPEINNFNEYFSYLWDCNDYVINIRFREYEEVINLKVYNKSFDKELFCTKRYNLIDNLSIVYYYKRDWEILEKELQDQSQKEFDEKKKKQEKLKQEEEKVKHTKKEKELRNI